MAQTCQSDRNAANYHNASPSSLDDSDHEMRTCSGNSREELPSTKAGLGHCWRPYTFRWPYQLLLIITSITGFTVLETLRQLSLYHKGLAQFTNEDEISAGLFVVYNYLPTIMGVIYSQLWSFIDLDIKRLEPYFRMRYDKKSPASILLLDYTFKSQFTLPFRALSRKHYVVALTSVVYLLISLILPASLSALFSLKPNFRNEDASFYSTAQIRGPHSLYQGNFVNQLQPILASDTQLMPPWTTLEFSVEPFASQAEAISPNETWTAHTAVAFAEPYCPVFQVTNLNVTHKCCSLTMDNAIGAHIVYVTADLELTGEHGNNCYTSLSMSTWISLHAVSAGPWQTNSFWVPHDTDLIYSKDTRSVNLTNLGRNSGPAFIDSFLYPNIEPVYYQTYGSTYFKDIQLTCPLNPRITGLLTYEFHEGLDEQLTLFNRQWNSSSGSSANESASQIAKDVEDVLNNMITVRPYIYGCIVDYYSAMANVTIQGRNETVLDIGPLSQRQALDDNQFNKTSFETILDYGAVSSIIRPLGVESPSPGKDPNTFYLIPENISHIDGSSPGTWAIFSFETMDSVNLQYGLQYFNADFNPGSNDVAQNNQAIIEFGRAMEKMYRLVFNVAFSTVLQSQTPSTELIGLRQQQYISISISPPFAILTEILLIIALLLLLVLTYITPRRQSILQGDPGSVTAQCSLITEMMANLGPLKDSVLDLDRKSTLALKNTLCGWEISFDKDNHKLNLIPNNTIPSKASRIDEKATPKTTNSQEGDKLSLFIRNWGICLIISSLVSLIGILLFLRFWTANVLGFALQFEFSTFQPQLWSFLPAIIATSIEVFWLSIYRDLALLENWVRIRKGLSAKQSMSLQYSSKPPLLAMVLSVRQKHYFISLLSLLCVTTSILNVSMAGLFIQKYVNVPIVRRTTTQFTSSELPSRWEISNIPHTVSWGSTLVNITQNSSTVGWTDEERSFIPVIDENANADQNFEPMLTNYNSTTLGIAASLNCTKLPSGSHNFQQILGIWVENSVNESSLINGKARFPPSRQTNTSEYTCEAQFSIQNDLPSIYFHPAYPVSINESRFSDPQNGSELNGSFRDQWSDSSQCSIELLFSYANAKNRTVDFYFCQPHFEVNAFSLIHSMTGTIEASEIHESPALLNREQIRNIENFGDWYAYTWERNANLSYQKTPVCAYDWPGLLMAQLLNKDKFLSIAEAANRIFAKSFAVWFSTYRSNFLNQRERNEPSLSSFEGTKFHRELRIMPSIPAFGISIAFLFFYLASYIFILVNRRHRYTGPRIPKSIGSLIPWVIHSRMIHDFKGLYYLKDSRRDDHLTNLGNKYGFGRFRGANGKVRLGIEYEENLMAKGAYGDF